MRIRAVFGCCLVLALLASAAPAAEKPFHEAELIFPLDALHNHGSCIVEAPNGDLLVAWYRGSGERQADDVRIHMARRPKGSRTWETFVVADREGFPDANASVFIDAKKRLWLIWPTIIANEWHTALLNYWISSDYQRRGSPPKWEITEVLLPKPDIQQFSSDVNRWADEMLKTPNLPEQAAGYLKQLKQNGADKYFSRMGWMPRAHPTALPSGRLLLPLYSDGYSFSLIAITDDLGKTWSVSRPIVGAGNIQPSIVRRKDGTLVAYMRDNGPPPKRLQVSTSSDEGVTWSTPRDSEIPNPGAGAEALRLRSGEWVLIYNDTERGRHSLAVSLSDDEGETWKWTRHLELDKREKGAGSFHYPTIVQSADGLLHASYSYFLNHLPAGEPRKSIKHAAFNVEWIKAGDGAQ